MNVYVMVQEDRHADTEITVFSDRTKAIGTAVERAREFDRFNDLDEELTPEMQRSGWLYYGRYSVEGAHVRVEAKEIVE